MRFQDWVGKVIYPSIYPIVESYVFRSDRPNPFRNKWEYVAEIRQYYIDHPYELEESDDTTFIYPKQSIGKTHFSGKGYASDYAYLFMRLYSNFFPESKVFYLVYKSEGKLRCGTYIIFHDWISFYMDKTKIYGPIPNLSAYLSSVKEFEGYVLLDMDFKCVRVDYCNRELMEVYDIEKSGGF